MRRTVTCLRGAKGHGWYHHYRQSPDDFAKFTAVTPFDWAKPSPLADPAAPLQRPKVALEISSGGELWGKLEFELAQDVVPRTVDNFLQLVRGSNAKQLSYKGSKFHQVRKGYTLLGGDVEGDKSGERSHSALGERFFADENFIIPHTHRGLLSMASVGVNTNGSQFHVSLAPAPHLNGRSVVFGRLSAGEDVLARIEKVFTYKGVPATDIIISACEVVEKK